MHILGKRKGKAILLAGGLALASLATPASADHDSANLAPLAAFIAFRALLHHQRHDSHRHYYYQAPRHYHAPRRHSHSHGGYQDPGKYRHGKHGDYADSGKHRHWKQGR